MGEKLFVLTEYTVSQEDNFYDFLFPSLASKFFSKATDFNPVCTGGLFHCYMVDEPICHVRGVGSILSQPLNF